MMIVGGNSRTTVQATKKRLAEIQAELPPGVKIDPIYDREGFVGRTLATVLRNLIEGALVVTIVLCRFLATFPRRARRRPRHPERDDDRGLRHARLPRDGRPDEPRRDRLRLLVDGPIVILEAVMATAAKRSIDRPEPRRHLYGGGWRRGATGRVLRRHHPPCTCRSFRSRGSRQRCSGRWRFTMACALRRACLPVVFPALLATFVPPPKNGAEVAEGARALVRAHPHGRDPRALGPRRRRHHLARGDLFLLARGRRLHSAHRGGRRRRHHPARAVDSLAKALSELDLATERVLKRFPEVKTTLGMTGRAEVAIDPVGSDNTDPSRTSRRRRVEDDRRLLTTSRSASRTRSRARCRAPSSPCPSRSKTRRTS